MIRFSVRLTDSSSTESGSCSINPGTADVHTGIKLPSVSTHIDYFHIHQALEEAMLVLEVFCDVPPGDYLLVLAFTHSPAQPVSFNKVRESLPTRLKLPQRSQMTESEAIRDRICSPTCIQMLLEYHELFDDKHSLIADCLDGSVNLYGVWPVNIAAASKRGLIGGIESFSDFSTVYSLLELNIPLVCSIRFNAGELRNAPLDKTTGHLVILAGIDEYFVNVYDPAASTNKTVLRNYARNEFHNAWIDNHGIAYVLVPCDSEKAKSVNDA